MKAIKKFEVSLEDLSEKERLIIEKLTKACELIVPLFEYQKNADHKGANFYPHDLSKEEIRAESEKNPQLLHPYTFVERNRFGKLKAVPFCVKFKKELKQIGKLLDEAAKLSEDKDFSHYLKELSRCLLKNEYPKCETLWVKKEPFKISFMMGPVERYFDRMFFRKSAYQAWLGILDQERTEEAERFKEVILASQRKFLADAISISPSDLKIEINRTICFAGQKAESMPTGTNLPNDIELIEKYGSKLTIFESSLKLNFREKNYPIFKTIFDPKLQDYFSEHDLYVALLRCVLLHEISHSLIRYHEAEKRLEELFPVLDELLAYILGIRFCGILLLKGVIEQKGIESIISVFLARCFRYWLEAKTNPGRLHYALACAITLNFLLESGSLKEKDGRLYPDFNKIFISLDHLSRIIEYYLASGSYEEVKEFIDSQSSFTAFERLGKKIKNILK